MHCATNLNHFSLRSLPAPQHYSDAIKFFPEASGPPARVALGLAAYKLGQIDRAKACFDRAIEMDGGITEAVVGR